MENHTVKTTPRDFFLYLGTAVGLYAGAGALLALLFAIINALLPDPLAYSFNDGDGARFAVATLVVAFPLYLALSWRVKKDIVNEPARRTLGVRKWFVWFTLFIAGGAVAGDIIALLNSFLGGELTARFVWKAVAVLGVAGAVGWYYFAEVRSARREPAPAAKPRLTLVILSSLAVLGVIVWSFAVFGSPARQRATRLDERRAENLQSIQWQLVSYWQDKGELPEELAPLSDPLRGFVVPTDPATGAAYPYRATAPRAFELCATFSTDTTNEGSDYRDRALTIESPGISANWQHPAGEYCFERTIDPDFFPVRGKTQPVSF